MLRGLRKFFPGRRHAPRRISIGGSYSRDRPDTLLAKSIGKFARNQRGEYVTPISLNFTDLSPAPIAQASSAIACRDASCLHYFSRLRFVAYCSRNILSAKCGPEENSLSNPSYCLSATHGRRASSRSFGQWLLQSFVVSMISRAHSGHIPDRPRRRHRFRIRAAETRCGAAAGRPPVGSYEPKPEAATVTSMLRWESGSVPSATSCNVGLSGRGL